MPRFRFTFLVFLLSFLLCPVLCAAEPLSAPQAEELLRAHFFRTRPNTDPTYTFTLTDRTTDEIWQNLGAQVFQIKDAGFQNGCGVLIKQGQVHWLGGCTGGVGLLSLAVADVNKDRSPELYYSYSFGSGLQRCEIGVYSERNAKAQTVGWKDAYLGDLFLEKTDAQTVLVQIRPYDAAKSGWGPVAATLGKIIFRQKLSGPSVKVRQDPKLPKELRDNLWSRSFPK